jgi:glyoxylase-like metal-dependent hydrolase (beta-lactamase superfamily II)
MDKAGVWQVGDVRITKILEVGSQSPPFPVEGLFPEANADSVRKYPWLVPHFAEADGRIHFSIHAFVVDTGAHRIVVDTCVGNDKKRSMANITDLHGPFLDDLGAAGYEPEAIDTVLCTHLHFDHVGWHTKLVGGKWQPTFPRATYLFGRVELEHWNAPGRIFRYGDILADSVRPVFDAGLARLVEMDHRVCDEVNLEPTPGHTPGHVAVRIRSRGEEAVITGDLLHHPIQCGDPVLETSGDRDREVALATRLAFLQGQADRPVLVLGTHFAAPTGGWVRRDGLTWRFAVDPQ